MNRNTRSRVLLATAMILTVSSAQRVTAQGSSSAKATTIKETNLRDSPLLPFEAVSTSDTSLSSSQQDVLTVYGDLITAQQQRDDPRGSTERLLKGSSSATKGATASVVRFSDGAVGLDVPVPLSAQVDPRVAFSRSTSEQAAADQRQISSILGSGDVKFRDLSGIRGDVLGSDNRTRATPTNYYPRNAIGQLVLGDGSVCSGVLYGPNVVVTAAHCLYSNGGWKGFPNWTFYPGRDGASAPMACSPSTAFILGGFPSSNTPQNDLGGVKLNCWIGGSTGNGYYPLVAIYSAIQTYIDGLYIVGYPVYAQGQYVAGQQWEDVGRLIYDTSYLKTLNTDLTGGQSGGLWAVPCNAYGWYYCEVGPTKGDVSAPPFGGFNIAHFPN